MKKAEKILSVPFAVSGFMSDISHTQSKTLEPKHLINYQHPLKWSELQNKSSESFSSLMPTCWMLWFEKGFIKYYAEIV